MSGKKEVHTVPNPEGKGWVNELGGVIVSQHRKQQPAIETGRSIAINRETEHVIHGRSGKIREKNSYGPDDYPPRG